MAAGAPRNAIPCLESLIQRGVQRATPPFRDDGVRCIVGPPRGSLSAACGYRAVTGVSSSNAKLHLRKSARGACVLVLFALPVFYLYAPLGLLKCGVAARGVKW